MKISLIIAWPKSEGPMVRGAWDEYRRKDNETGFQEELKSECNVYSTEHVRVLDIEIPVQSIDRAFDTPLLLGKISKA
jgi:hypothetical protein